MANKNRFGKNLKLAKAEHDFSYRDMAKKLDTSESTISYYQDREDTKFIEFLFLLRQMGVDINKLFT